MAADPAALDQGPIDAYGRLRDQGALQTRLNALPQFVTQIQGVDIHFLHLRSPHQGALPLLITTAGPARSSSCWRSSAR